MTARQQIARLLPLVLLVILVAAGLRGEVSAPRWNGPLGVLRSGLPWLSSSMNGRSSVSPGKRCPTAQNRSNGAPGTVRANGSGCACAATGAGWSRSASSWRIRARAGVPSDGLLFLGCRPVLAQCGRCP